MSIPPAKAGNLRVDTVRTLTGRSRATRMAASVATLLRSLWKPSFTEKRALFALISWRLHSRRMEVASLLSERKDSNFDSKHIFKRLLAEVCAMGSLVEERFSAAILYLYGATSKKEFYLQLQLWGRRRISGRMRYTQSRFSSAGTATLNPRHKVFARVEYQW